MTTKRRNTTSLKRRRLLQLASTYGISGGVTGAFVFPERGLAQGRGKKGGTLVMVMSPEPPNLASFYSTANGTSMVASKCYDGLLEFDCHPNVGREAVVGDLLPVTDGRVPVPQTPGLGAVPDLQALAPYRTWGPQQR